MKSKDKTNAQLIIEVLMTGKTLKSKDIAEMITERELNIQDVASMLSKISDEKKCELGHFIRRVRVGPAFVYSVVREALKLSEDKAYDLTLKRGKDRYTLDHALKEFPKLRRYVNSAKIRGDSKTGESKKKIAEPKRKTKTAEPKRKAAKKPTKSEKPAIRKAVHPEKEPATASKSEKDIEKVASEIIQKLIDLALNTKVNVSVDFEE